METTQNSLVSVVILSYNNCKGIPATLQSIFKQNYSRIEIVIGDDGSSDFDQLSLEKDCEQAPENIEFIQIRHGQQNVGTVKNINETLKLVHGDIVCLIASEDTYHDETSISKIVEAFQNDELVDAVTSKIQPVDGQGRAILPPKPTLERAALIAAGGRPLLEYLYMVGNIICGAGAAYRWSSIIKYGLFDEELILVEDFPSFLKILQGGGKIAFLPHIILDYYVGDDPKNKRYSQSVLNDLYRIDEKYIVNRCNISGIRSILDRKHEMYTATTFFQKLKIAYHYPIATIRVVYYKWKIKRIYK